MAKNKQTSVYLIMCFIILVTVKCTSQSSVRDAEYHNRYGNFSRPFLLAKGPINVTGYVANGRDFIGQVLQIQFADNKIYERNKLSFDAVDSWILHSGNIEQLNQYNIEAVQLRGINEKGDFLLTGYYTPELEVRAKRDKQFRLPIYRFPPDVPTTEPTVIYYKTHENPIIGYCNSISDISMFSYKGIGFVDYGDKSPPDLFSYVKPGDYNQSIFDCLTTTEVSMYTRRRTVLRMKIKLNNTFAVLKPLPYITVRGSYNVPLIALTAVAADPSLVPVGTILLVEVPTVGILREEFRYKLRLLIMVDQGNPPVEGFQLDMYHGHGKKAVAKATKYWHYVRVWELVCRVA